jgi:hypothetical protein
VAQAGTERQRPLQRVRLGLGDLLEHDQGGPQELKQRGERDLGLGLDAPRPEHSHAPGQLGGVIEQRRLANSRLTQECQHGALAGPRLS